jgi:hypothetical protein
LSLSKKNFSISSIQNNWMITYHDGDYISRPYHNPKLLRQPSSPSRPSPRGSTVRAWGPPHAAPLPPLLVFSPSRSPPLLPTSMPCLLPMTARACSVGHHRTTSCRIQARPILSSNPPSHLPAGSALLCRHPPLSPLGRLARCIATREPRH